MFNINTGNRNPSMRIMNFKYGTWLKSSNFEREIRLQRFKMFVRHFELTRFHSEICLPIIFYGAMKVPPPVPLPPSTLPARTTALFSRVIIFGVSRFKFRKQFPSEAINVLKCIINPEREPLQFGRFAPAGIFAVLRAFRAGIIRLRFARAGGMF